MARLRGGRGRKTLDDSNDSTPAGPRSAVGRALDS